MLDIGVNFFDQFQRTPFASNYLQQMESVCMGDEARARDGCHFSWRKLKLLARKRLSVFRLFESVLRRPECSVPATASCRPTKERTVSAICRPEASTGIPHVSSSFCIRSGILDVGGALCFSLGASYW